MNREEKNDEKQTRADPHIFFISPRNQLAMRSNTAAEDAMPMVEETVGMGAAETTVTADGATVVELSAFEDIDDQHLARLGYKPVR